MSKGDVAESTLGEPSLVPAVVEAVLVICQAKDVKAATDPIIKLRQHEYTMDLPIFALVHNNGAMLNLDIEEAFEVQSKLLQAEVDEVIFVDNIDREQIQLDLAMAEKRLYMATDTVHTKVADANNSRVWRWVHRLFIGLPALDRNLAPLVHAGAVVGSKMFTNFLTEGGITVSFRARDTGTGEDAVVKITPKSRIRSLDTVLRLKDEFVLHTRLDHPNIVKCESIFHGLDNFYLVMEYASGINLFRYAKAMAGELKIGRAHV